MIPASIGPYRILRKLGEGGMGTVYEAVQDPIDRRVAVKVLHPNIASAREMVERLFLEARSVNMIEHPGLVQVSDYGNAADGTAFIAMEFLRGQSLSAKLAAQKGPLPLKVALEICWQIADALTAVHQKGIVHRDLKPENIMLVPDPVSVGGHRAKILDFGIAKLMTEGGQRTRPDIVMGTPAYMSPEQCRGAGAVDEKTDVYALGIILFELLAGRRPYADIEGLAVLIMHVFSPPPILCKVAKAVTPEVSRLVDSMLVKDAATRMPMSEVRDRLAALLSNSARHTARWNLQTVVPIALALCIGAGFAMRWLVQYPRHSQQTSQPHGQKLTTPIVTPVPKQPVADPVLSAPPEQKEAESVSPRLPVPTKAERQPKPKPTLKAKPPSMPDSRKQKGGYRDPFQPL